MVVDCQITLRTTRERVPRPDTTLAERIERRERLAARWARRHAVRGGHVVVGDVKVVYRVEKRAPHYYLSTAVMFGWQEMPLDDALGC